MRKFGYIPGVKDQRDHLLKVAKQVTTPKAVDLRKYDSSIEDQGSIGSCVGHAITGLLEHLDIKNGAGHQNMSRLFVYYNARKLDKLPKMSDYGTYIKSAIKAVKKWGASPEKAWPYRQGKVNRKPSRKSYRTARRFRIVEYAKIGDKLSDMQECLAAGYPFAFGIPVYDSFMKVGKSGRAKIPKLSENMLGGHAMLCVGYSKPGKYFIVKNSWGRSYGKKGYVYIPFKYMAQANECWTINQINYGEESI